MNQTYSDVLFPQETSNSSNLQENGSSNSSSVINVGWFASEFDVKEDLDRSIAEFSSNLGNQNYNFVAYPIGGIHRAFWRYASEGTPPPINLPDLQLANPLWETYICGRVSPWIDCDSEDGNLARLSEEELLKELNYVSYLGLRTIIIELKRIHSPKLARIVNKWLWTKHSIFSIWIQLPPCINELLDYRKCSQYIDLWTVWADFRKNCAQYSGGRLKVSLRFSCELPDEFIEDKLIERWNAEPLAALVVDSDSFITGRNGMAELSRSHQSLLQKMWMSDVLRILLNQTNDLATHNVHIKKDYSLELRKAVQDITWLRRKEAGKTDGFLADSNIEYYDVVQAPLQPLSDNLDSGIYNTFEQDPVKYQKYGEAVEQALVDIGEIEPKPRNVVVYLLGGGRGPLGTQILEAESRYNRKYRVSEKKLRVRLHVVEKNTNAIVTLKYINDKGWMNRATIIESDMRSLPRIARERNLEQPDIIVSELLGSFGDNELSPECLDGVTSFLKPTTISIPQKYTSYAAPIMSLYMHQEIKSLSTNYWNKGIAGHGRSDPLFLEDGSYVQEYPQGHSASRLDQIYVVYLKKFCALAETKPVFTFEHPNFMNTCNVRSNVVEFKIDRRADIMGFAGYFDMVLYKDIMLSIVPKSSTPAMISWFPAVIPLRDLVRVDDGDTIRLLIDRKIDEGGVWYEWCSEIEKPNGEKLKTVLQNKSGESYYMRM